MVIYAGSINRDHVHMLIGIPPNLSVSRAVQYLKGKSSHKLLSEYQHLKKKYWGQHLWGRVRIPVNPATHSALHRPPIPVQTGHPVARL